MKSKNILLKERLITSIILIPVIISTLFLFPSVIFFLLIILICLLSAWEWGRIIKLNHYEQVLWISIFFVILIFLMKSNSFNYCQVINNPYRTTFILWISFLWWLIISPLLIIYYIYSIKLNYKNKFVNLIFGFVIILPFFDSITKMYNWSETNSCYIGKCYIFYIMILVWSLDSCAYIFGNLFGKHKLSLKISPNKTLEGLLGGVCVALIIVFVFSKYKVLNLSSYKLYFCSVFTIISAILGDLIESLFKREAKIKDSSCLIPGHGGALDLIDSLLAAVPTFYFFNSFYF